MPFSTIFFDIVGACNARCPYCNTGKYKKGSSGIIKPEDYAKAVSILCESGLIHKDLSLLSLYCWGEPFLHPNLDEIINITNAFELPYAFSTNASVIPHIDRSFVQGLKRITFSMSGFSQASYDRIHGFKFNDIVSNIESITQQCRNHGSKAEFVISYHTYQFNMGEIYDAEDFAKSIRIKLSPIAAIQNNWDHLVMHAQGELPLELKLNTYKDLLDDNFQEIITTAPRHGFSCSLLDMLVIDEKCNVLQCCQVPSGTQYSPGNLLTTPVAELLQRKNDSPTCTKCIDLGLAQYFERAYKVPDFYTKYNSFKHQLRSKVSSAFRRGLQALSARR